MSVEREHTLDVGVLRQLVEKVEFKKTSSAFIVLPFIFMAPALIMLLRGLHALFEYYVSTISGGELGADASTELLYLTWGGALYGGYVLSSTIASYLLLKRLSTHLRDSAIATYYFTGGSKLEALLNMIHQAYTKHSLPSPGTGLVLGILSAGLSYPILLLMAESALREHASLEEVSLLGREYTRSRGLVRQAIDFTLLLLTLGVYGVVLGARYANLFNRHYEMIHKYHPNPPPSQLASQPVGEGGETPSKLVAGLILAFTLTTTLSAVGVNTAPLSYVWFGLLLGVVMLALGEKSYLLRVLVGLGIIYAIISTGALSGLLLGMRLEWLVKEAMRQLEPIATMRDFWWLTLAIFVNNLSISASAIIPFIGPYYVASGTFNAGFIAGLLVATGRRSLGDLIMLLVMPHAILELLAYSILASSAPYLLRDSRKLVFSALLGVLTLFVAAVVESITILHLG
jgi:hypothetical protein